MTTFLKWHNSPLVILVLLCTGAIVDLVLVGREFDLSKSDWASWVQAIGSIAAILFAYVLGEKQAKVAFASVREADKIAAQRKFDSILAVADSAKAYAEETYKCFSRTEVRY